MALITAKLDKTKIDDLVLAVVGGAEPATVASIVDEVLIFTGPLGKVFELADGPVGLVVAELVIELVKKSADKAKLSPSA